LRSGPARQGDPRWRLPVGQSRRTHPRRWLGLGDPHIAGYTGEILDEADREEETVLTATVDLDEAAKYRVNWGVFRDRRPDLYGAVASLDGRGC
ncbi:MAG: hypothetical protein AAGF56_15495, partial [Pseudomonadota bacterium]